MQNFWVAQGTLQAQKAQASLGGGEGSGGMLPQEIFKIEHSETPFSAFLEPEIQFPRKGWSSLKFWEMMSQTIFISRQISM